MTALVLAQMWDDHNHKDGGWWWVMGIGFLLFLAFIGFLVYLLVRHHTDSGTSTARRSTAEDLLAERRLARGEIDEDEYRRRRDALRSSPNSGELVPGNVRPWTFARMRYGTRPGGDCAERLAKSANVQAGDAASDHEALDLGGALEDRVAPPSPSGRIRESAVVRGSVPRVPANPGRFDAL